MAQTNNGVLADCVWDKSTYTSELPQIRKYGGFYVARYEAGLANTITEVTSTQSYGSSVYNKEGIPQSKAGIIPWIFINWNNSQKNAKNMYNTYSVSSGLITGTQWDVMLKQIVARTDLTEGDLTNATNWGNYMSNSIEYTGRMAKGYKRENTWYLSAFGGKTTNRTTNYGSNGTNGDLLTTGASRTTEKYHIFDVAGNVQEWTDEFSVWNGQSHIYRDLGYIASGTSVCFRAGKEDRVTYFRVGFRVVLYIK